MKIDPIEELRCKHCEGKGHKVIYQKRKEMKVKYCEFCGGRGFNVLGVR